MGRATPGLRRTSGSWTTGSHGSATSRPPRRLARLRLMVGCTGGFIDPHTHARRGIFQVPTADNALLQGVTTLTEGNDGSSPLPVGEHLEQIAETGISPNWAVFVVQGTVRSAVIGRDDRDPVGREERFGAPSTRLILARTR